MTYIQYSNNKIKDNDDNSNVYGVLQLEQYLLLLFLISNSLIS